MAGAHMAPYSNMAHPTRLWRNVMRRILLIAAAASGLLRAAVDWPVATPRSQGFDPARLDAFQRNAVAHHTRALIVIRNGRVVLEWYEAGAGPDTRQGTASLAKALVGGMSLLVALNDGRIRPDDQASKFISRWRGAPQKGRITIRQLATHTSGISDAERDALSHDQLPGWKGAFWTRKPDPISIALDQAPVLFAPGTVNQYSNPGMAALAYRARYFRVESNSRQSRYQRPIAVPTARAAVR